MRDCRFPPIPEKDVQVLETMQNDPEQEKETKELIRGVESAMNVIDSINKAAVNNQAQVGANLDMKI